MKRTLGILVVVAMSLTASACSKQKSTPVVHKPEIQPAPQPVAPAPQAPNWKLSFKSECEGAEAGQCVGYYGFTVSNDGHYILGPGPSGQTESGVLTDEERRQIEGTVSQVLAPAHHASADTCRTLEQATGKSTIHLTVESREEQLVRTEGTSFCHQNANQDEAQALHNAIVGLAKKYYALPFPDACKDAARAVEALYVEVQGCQQDSDCVYVNNNSYGPVVPGSEQWIATDSCELVKPILTANNSLIGNQAGRIIEAYNAAYAACGADRMYRDNCSPQGFLSSEAAPKCIEGACRINPSILAR